MIKLRQIKLHRQKGFTLVTAIFLLVVLAAVGSFMVTIGGTQRTTSVAAVQGARAYQAARSGIEWAIYRVITDGDCSMTNGQSFTTSVSGLNNFTVSLACTPTTHSEAGTNNVNVFVVSSTATFSTYGNLDFVQRRISATISP
jgi:MSHA biogenesis protein MshP